MLNIILLFFIFIFSLRSLLFVHGPLICTFADVLKEVALYYECPLTYTSQHFLKECSFLDGSIELYFSLHLFPTDAISEADL